jgi:aspartokinase
MERIRLGGIKIAEGRSHLVTARATGESALPEICGRLAAHRINLNHLASSLADDEGDETVSLSVDRADGFTSYFQIRALLGGSDRVQLVEDVNILAIFPHDKKPGVTGNLLAQLAAMSIPIHGFASTPAAMAFVAAAADTARVIDGLFEAFTFPAYPSPFDWHAAYQGREQVLREIICSYEEQVIKVYNVAQETDLDLWCLELPVTELGTLGAAFHDLEEAGIRLPFLVAVPTLNTPETLRISCCLARGAQPRVSEVFTHRFPSLDAANPHRARPAALFTLVGPHFGDRHGITDALVNAMRNADIHPRAMSCAVHSISVVVPEADLDRTLQAIAGPFDIPS